MSRAQMKRLYPATPAAERYGWHTCPPPNIDELPVLTRRCLWSAKNQVAEELIVIDRVGRVRSFRRHVINNRELWTTWRRCELDLDQVREKAVAATAKRKKRTTDEHG